MKQCVVLTGGFGSRLGPLTQLMPKPLLEVGGRPFVEWVMIEAARHGFERILLIAGHMGGQLAVRYDGRLILGARISVFVEVEPQGTGGAMRAALPALDEVFLTCNGDSLFAFNLLGLLWPPPGGARVALRPMPDVARYGAVVVSGERVLSFSEKTAAGPGMISGGVYALTRASLALLPVTGPASLESQLFPLLAERGLLSGRAFEGYFIDIGAPERLSQARAQLAEQMRRPAAFLAAPTEIFPEWRLPNPAASPASLSRVRRLNDAGYYVIVLEDPAVAAPQTEARKQIFQDSLRSGGAHVDVFGACPDWIAAAGSHAQRLVPGATLGGLLARIPADLPARSAASFLVTASPTALRLARECGMAAYGTGADPSGGGLEAALAKLPR